MTRNFVADALGSFLGDGGGSVAGCGNSGNDPLNVAESLSDMVQRVQVRALLDNAPQVIGGLASTVNPVLANTAFTSSLTPPIAMRPTRLVFPGSTGPFFTLSAITIGLCTVIVAGNPPAETFSPDATNPPIDFGGILAPGTPMTITGNNIDGNNHRADMAIWGVNMSGPYASLCTMCPV
jgi:hypothetical protein